jgi:hypothetical protein
MRSAPPPAAFVNILESIDDLLVCPENVQNQFYPTLMAGHMLIMSV